MVELRAKGVSETCPLCRSRLPPGSEKLFELGYRVWAKLDRAAVEVGGEYDGSWRELSAPQQDEMDGAIVMLQEATDQVSGWLCSLASLPAPPHHFCDAPHLAPGPHHGS